MAIALLWAERLAQPVLSVFPSKCVGNEGKNLNTYFSLEQTTKQEKIFLEPAVMLKKIPYGSAMISQQKLSGDPETPCGQFPAKWADLKMG